MAGRRGRILIVSAAQDVSRLLRLFSKTTMTLHWSTKEPKRCVVCRNRPRLIWRSSRARYPICALPDMIDVQLVRAIRKIHLAHRRPLIMLAEDSGPDVITLAFQSGADNCLMRPFTEAALTARIEALPKVKRSFDEARAMNAELEAAAPQRFQIYRMATQDLQSPLNNIRLAESSLRRAAAADPSEMTQSLDMIRQMVDAMGDIIADYLDVMELRSGQMQVKMKPINLRDVIVNVVTQFEPAARMKNIRLKIEAAEGWVIADAARVVQVLGNLVSNAIKYSPYESAVRIYTSDEADMALLTVEDQGPGIPREDRARLFQEYRK